MAGSRPTTLNFGAGFASAPIDCCPVLGSGGSSPISQTGRQGKLRRLLRGRGAVPRRRDDKIGCGLQAEAEIEAPLAAAYETPRDLAGSLPGCGASSGTFRAAISPCTLQIVHEPVGTVDWPDRGFPDPDTHHCNNSIF